jgi:hypothetical protein
VYDVGLSTAAELFFMSLFGKQLSGTYSLHAIVVKSLFEIVEKRFCNLVDFCFVIVVHTLFPSYYYWLVCRVFMFGRCCVLNFCNFNNLFQIANIANPFF